MIKNATINKKQTQQRTAALHFQDGSIPAIPYKFVAIGELGSGAQRRSTALSPCDAVT